MSRVSKMSLKQILKEVYLLVRNDDIIHFCNNIQVVEEYLEKFSDSQGKKEEIEKFLIENEEYIDKEKFVLLMVLNYRENIKLIEQQIDILKKQYFTMASKDFFEKSSTYHIQLHEQKPNYEKAKKLAKGINKVLIYYYYNEEQEKFKLDVVDSKELLEGIKISSSKAQKRFDEVDSNFKDKDTDELGLEYVLQSIILTDFSNIFVDEQFGDYVRTMILENAVLETGIKANELEVLRNIEDDSEYRQLVENVDFENLLPSIKDTLREYAQYLDMDKLLLVSAYRFEEGLEGRYIEDERCLSVKEILQGILANIKSNNAEIICELQKNTDDEYEMEKIKYSVKDIRRCISQFTEHTFLSRKQIENYRERVNNKEINLCDIDSEYIDIIFSQKDLQEITTLSVDNLIYVYQRYNLDVSKIIELYNLKEISLEDIRIIKGEIDLSNSISFEDLILYYQQVKDNLQDEEIANRYKNYLQLYKELFITDKDKETLELDSNIIMQKIIETFEGKQYNEAVKEFYKERIITLNAISEWSNQSLLIELFNEGLINLEEVTKLVKEEKLSVEHLNKIYFNLVNAPNIEYDERLRLIKNGYVLEKDIFDLYRRNLIFEKDLTQLASDGIVRSDEARRVINSRTMRELERNSAIRLTGLNSLTKKNSDIYSYGYGSIGTEASTRQTGKFIIDPNERERFIRMLNAYKANTDLASDSPFYNYEFYVIPDETGTIGLNSVVIAERYYEDKDTELRFAMNNATYFFKYKDLMVLGNLRKSEMTKERENIVFTANHVIANDKREGRWATSVISCVAKTMLSSDLKEYSKANRRRIIQQKLSEIYTTQQLIDILTMVSDIDLGEYICEIEDPEVKTSRKSLHGYKRYDGSAR